MKNLLLPLSVIAASVAMAAVSAQGQTNYTFTGATSSDPTVASNYSGGMAPTFGGGTANPVLDNGNPFSAQTAGNNPFVYSASLGTTVFNAYTYTSAVNGANGVGTINVTGGSLSFGGNLTSSASQNVLGNGLVNVSGGTLNFLNGNTSDGSSLWIGNNNGNGTVNVSGGMLTTQNGVIFGRDGSTGTMTVTGGVVNIQGTAGSAIGSGNGGATGTGILNLSAGIYEQTASNTLSFTAGSHINFTLGSTAQLSLNGATTASLQALVTAGDIYINGAVDTNTADYRYTISGAQGILSLPSAVPEPSTWAMIGIGGLALLAWARRIRAAASLR